MSEYLASDVMFIGDLIQEELPDGEVIDLVVVFTTYYCPGCDSHITEMELQSGLCVPCYKELKRG